MLVALLAVAIPRATAGQGEATAARLRIRSGELRYATAPAPGVWAELKVVLDNPLAAVASSTSILVPGSFLDDFAVRGSVPELVAPPTHEADGRASFVFPAPIGQSLN